MPKHLLTISNGLSHPLGVTLRDGGVNVAVASASATKIFVALFDGTIETARFNLPTRSGDIFHGFIHGVKAGQHYGLRAEGNGTSFDAEKLLLDPYATQITEAFAWHDDLTAIGMDTAHLVPKAIVAPALVKLASKLSKQPNVIYEVSVKALTALHPDVPDHQRGTVAALSHPSVITHLKTLGVDTIELMPLMAWVDERHLARNGLSNAWGYNSISFFAPDPRLAPSGMTEIRNTISALHDADFQVLLDVVFNHSGESDLGGATLSFRGLDNTSYYALHEGQLVNDTGCGNTLALQNPIALRLVMDALRYWVEIAGFDGFRYDLASVLGRDQSGYSPTAPLMQAIGQDPILRNCIHIAEPWDIGLGGYQLGQFPPGWGEWNDRYRDDVRHFWRGDAHAQGAFATRLCGSEDLFKAAHRRPSASVNFIAAHDGFALEDVVQFSAKNNYANGENNRDGNGAESCWVSADPERDVRALLATLFLSRGTVMLTAGDEFGRSQNGNNNAYAQDNETTWLNWVSADRDRLSFTSALIQFRKANSVYFADNFIDGNLPADGSPPDGSWIAASGSVMAEQDWQHRNLLLIGLSLRPKSSSHRLLLIFNRGDLVGDFNLPTAQDGLAWQIADPIFASGNVLSKDKIMIAQRSACGLIEMPTRSGKVTKANDALVKKLAAAAGIQKDWWEVNGTHHQVSLDSMRHLLAAMDLPITAASDVSAALAELDLTQRNSIFQRCEARRSCTISIGHTPFRAMYNLCLENGETVKIAKAAGASELAVPPLPPGLHRLLDDNNTVVRQILAQPAQCYLPQELQMGRRHFGVGTHLYALSDGQDWGIGDFKTLGQFAETIGKNGGTFAGINPLHHMFTKDRERVSPYQPSDRRFLDPIYIAIDGHLAPAAINKLRALPHVDYARVWDHKEKALRKLYAAKRSSSHEKSLQEFIIAGGPSLQQHGKFEGDAGFAIWLQWLADQQLGQAALQAKAAGLTYGIYRDLALGCAYEGGELAGDPDLFAASVSIGSPPDPFSADGQVWNLPPHNPLALRKRNFAPFREILAANMRHAGMLRIDHVLGLARQFWVPRGGSGADGAYVTMPMDDLMAIVALESQANTCIIIGEDLGTVPDGLRQKMADVQMLSYKMLWFEREGQRFTSPQNYPQSALTCLSSHDLKPFRGWEASTTAAERAGLLAVTNGPEDLMIAAHKALAHAPSLLMQIQADDLAEEIAPLNVPGTDKEYPNWQRRIHTAVDHLFDSDAAKAVIAAVTSAQSETR